MSQINKEFYLAACGGTFDLFHKGHREILTTAAKLSKKLIIGVVSDEFAKNLKEEVCEPFVLRSKTVREFVNKEKINAEIIELNDIYGPTISSELKFDAIFVTKDSEKGALKINEKRRQLNLPDLKIIKVALVKIGNEKTLSSTLIRSGQIDRNGNLYINDDFLKSDYLLPDKLRHRLSEPFGELIKDFDRYLKENKFDSKKLISVGDVVTSKFTRKRIFPKVAIVDLIVNRRKKFENIHELGFKNAACEKVDNPAGHISRDLIKKVKESMNKENLVIQINGEEDLAVIPAVLAAPLGYEIFYGQPGEGVVRIKVSEENKKEIKDLISQFRRKVI